VLVTRALAGVLADGGDAVGTLFRIEEDGTDHRVIGVVENVELAGLESPWGEEGIIYLSDPARGPTSPVFVLRTSGDPRALLPLVRGMIAEIDPNQPVTRLAPVEDLMWEATLRPRFFLALMSTFALVALLLAAVGLYGLLSISVGQRRREIGVRAALGAERRGIHALIMANGLRLVVVGILIGAALSYYSSRVLDELLFETSRTDLLTLAVVASTMLAVASLASWVPARRATRVDPMEVLREE
jgi:predicted lysophospholipase L1 biosynthesis ABC-type transport system permease subunit